MKYKDFILDDFQIKAIEAVEKNKSVIVAAPTGVGKTLIAEYIIEKYLKEGKRIIYTAPIKALSNQKYRDFSRTWNDKVGIITGDVVINSSAQILIMTTEIFRNMLISEKEMLHDVKYVVFDEVHYINDIQRGVIWEESIIFALPEMRFLLLSATIPNVDEFAEWIHKIKKHPIEIIKEEKRVVPLKHFVYTSNAGVMPIEKFFKKYKLILNKKNVQLKKKNNFLHEKLINYLIKKELTPVIYFVFSRNGCEELAIKSARKYCFITEDEKKEVTIRYKEILKKYAIEEYDSITSIYNYLLKGIGIHHAGILPVMKELVECLYSDGLLKLLFVTETFAVGVNMPARTSIFNSLRKYDGISFRNLLGREYFQMAGRAGRRGIDTEGTTITVIDDIYANIEEFKEMIHGKLEPLESQFKLSYNTVVNLYKQYNDEYIKKILNMSYLEFQQKRKREEVSKDKYFYNDKIHELRESINCNNINNINKYKEITKTISKFSSKLKDTKQKIFDLNKHKGSTYHKLRSRQRSYSRLIDQLRRELSKIECSKCKHLKDCKNILFNIGEYSRKIDKIQTRSVVVHDQYELFNRKVFFLEKLGYLNKNELHYKGITASLVYGYELIISELLEKGIIEEFTDSDIAILTICIVFEKNPKSSYPFSGIVPNELKLKINRCRSIAFRLRKMEQAYNMELSKPIFIDAIEFAYRWVSGEDFVDVIKVCGDDEGDIIRVFRCAIDLLRQLKRCCIDNPVSREKIKSAIELINRDIVNASEIIA